MSRAEHIYVVDDTKDLLQNISEFLQMEGFIVSGFSDACAALQALDHGTPNVIITDLSMAAMDGLDFIKAVKAKPTLAHIPIIIFTARPRGDFEETAMRFGVSTFIKKPAALEQILLALKPFIL